MSKLAIAFEWMYGEIGGAAERATLAEISIRADGFCATELEDRLARTVRDRARLSAFHLAFWLAANWWRLRWEPETDSHSWSMSHAVGAAGGGYVWPNLAFVGDGATVLVRARPTATDDAEPVRYLSSFDCRLPASDFEFATDQFIEAVIDRLGQERVDDPDLRDIWQVVRGERGDPDLAVKRKLEAVMGLDPGEGDDEFVAGLVGRFNLYGQGAVEEIAAQSKDRSHGTLDVLDAARQRSIEARIHDCTALRSRIRSQQDRATLPWQQAEQAADVVRDVWDLDGEPVSNVALSNLVGIPVQVLDEQEDVAPPLPAAYRNGDEADFRVALSKKHPTARRFALVRLLGDHLVASSQEHLLPATNTKTARQKFQRAFAQEFLCPYGALLAYMENDFGEEAIADAARHFDVSEMLVTSTLVNKGDLPRDALWGFG